MKKFALATRLVVRTLRGGARGFGVFLACMTLGVAGIAAVGTIVAGLEAGLAREGRAILGGDLAFALAHREADQRERAFLDDLGDVSAAATLRAMARAPERDDPTLAEVKAVDGSYPLAGRLAFDPPAAPVEVFAQRDGVAGVAVEAALAARLGLEVGRRFLLAETPVELRAILANEPDKLAGGIGFGPRLVMSVEALRASGLLQPGALVRWHYRVRLADPSPARLDAIAAAAAARFPDAGWEIRSRANATPQLARNLDRFAQFLTLVGLTALVVGGVGVANAVKAHADRERETAATLKALGASGAFVVAVNALHAGALAALGIALGLALGVALPALAVALAADLLPIPVVVGLHPRPLGLAAACGALVAIAFAAWPLGRMHDVPVQALYRDRVSDDRRVPRARYLALLALALAALVGLVVGSAADRRLALVYVGAVAAAFVALRLVALGLAALARAAPRRGPPEWRMALAAIHRPGSLTPTVVLSLGLGLTLLVTLALVDHGLRRQLAASIPERAPHFFFVDVPSRELDAFRDHLAREAPGARLDTVPMLRGRIAALKGVPVEAYPAPPDASWVLSGERGVTYAARPPDRSEIVEGRWWAEDHAGPPLVSFDARLARALGLAVGDRVAVTVLGRRIEAAIANLRRVQWETFGINFVMVFSPDAFRGAPHSHLATATLPRDAPAAAEGRLLGAVTRAFPSVASIRVKEALEAADGLLRRLAFAAAAASSVTVLAALLVLAGALAASHRERIREAAILKTLGATRPRLIATYALEYALLGGATALFALAVGHVAAWAVLERAMDLRFAAAPGVAAAAVAAAAGTTVGLGLLGTWRILRRKPAQVLRGA